MPSEGRRLNPFSRRLILVSAGVLLLGAAAFLFKNALLTAAGSALIEDDGPAHAQAAVVLGGDEDAKRILKAAELAKAGYVPWILVSGPSGFGVHECDLTIPYAEGHGYPASFFRPYPDECKSTRDEADVIGKYLRDHKITRILLVTSNYHTRRAARLFRKQNPGLQVRAIAAPDLWFSPNGWWRNREGRKTFLLEWLKTLSEY